MVCDALAGASAVPLLVASCALIAYRLARVVPDRSLNFGCSATVPVMAAPDSPAACLTPVTTADGAPGSVTMTSRSPESVPSSSFGSAVLRNASLALACCS